MTTAWAIAAFLDDYLGVAGFPDYPAAINGLQLDHRGPVHKVATAVDFSARTISAAVDAGANLLILHHGMFWSGPGALTGSRYERLRALIEHDVAVYAVHLPLDAHPEIGNCALMARALDLVPQDGFGDYQGRTIGWRGRCDEATGDIAARADAYAQTQGGHARLVSRSTGARTRQWAVITGAGADSTSLRAAALAGIDTLIVGEGPHHTTVDAPEYGVSVIYAGHYATETLGVRSLAALVREQFGVPTQFLFLPTGS